MKMSPYQETIFKLRYARYNENKRRRESHPESVTRMLDFFYDTFNVKGFSSILYSELYDTTTNLQVTSAMRVLASAGEALKSNSLFGYNCSSLVLEDLYQVSCLFYRLMHGVGVGFSVEEKFISKMPVVSKKTGERASLFVVEDTKEGWMKAVQYTLYSTFTGKIPFLNYSLIRKKGTRLKTSGGRASGAEPLQKALDKVTEIILNASERKLTSVEWADICCHLAAAVVVGGVRRSAMICITDLNDLSMRYYKSGEWYVDNPQRSNANISTCYETKPTFQEFDAEWDALKFSYSGERGIFNRETAIKNMPARRRERLAFYGMLERYIEAVMPNPCGEIDLLLALCCLSSFVARYNDTKQTLIEKARLAAYYGTLQSMLLNFPHSPELVFPTSIERLIGVSISGIMDCPVLYEADPKFLEQLRDTVIEANVEMSKYFKVPPSTATTCIKPAGTESQMVDSSFSISPRWSEYYMRTVKNSSADPYTGHLIRQGVPHFVQGEDTLFRFPIKAPEGAITNKDVDAKFQLEMWLKFKKHWCEHNPSVTIYIRDHEWDFTRDWLLDHWENIGGLSFLPYEDPNSEFMARFDPRTLPFKSITEREYLKAVAEFPEITFDVPIEEDDSVPQIEHMQSCEGAICSI